MWDYVSFAVPAMSFSAPAALTFIVLAAFVVWAPIFTYAYARRQFGGTAAGYFMGFLLTSGGTVALFGLLWFVDQTISP